MLLLCTTVGLETAVLINITTTPSLQRKTYGSSIGGFLSIFGGFLCRFLLGFVIGSDLGNSIALGSTNVGIVSRVKQCLLCFPDLLESCILTTLTSDKTLRLSIDIILAYN